jgi:tetratricopeptide (TPR) repeat protein
LIQRGKVAARVGHTDEARELLRRVVELAPELADAWLALAGVEAEPAAKIACFERVLALEPDNSEAQQALDLLQSRLERQPAAAPDPADDLEAVIAEASRRLEKTVGPPPAGEVPPDDDVLYCANHPNVETMLRCNRCGKPICTRCAVQTPVGYRCRQCVGQQQAVFFNGGAGDYIVGGIVAVVLGGVANFLMGMLGYWFFALILGAPAGVAIAEVVRLSVRRRRSRYLWAVVGGGMIVGALPALLLSLTSLWSLLSLGIFLFLAVGAAVARLR